MVVLMQFERRQIILGAAAFGLGPLPARAQPARIPFTLLNGKMFVEVKIDGISDPSLIVHHDSIPAQAMIDTGAQWSAISQTFAAAHNIRTFGRVPFRGVQGTGTARKVEGAVMGFPGLTFSSDLVALDLARLAQDVRHPIDAVIGGDLFSKWVVDIDFDSHTLGILDPAGFTPPPGAKLVPLESFQTLMTAAVSIENRPPVRALVDLGSNVPLIVSPRPAKARGLLDGRKMSTRLIGGHGSGGVSQVTTARTISFGGESFAEVPVMVPPRPLGVEANIGLTLLWRFRLYLDFGNRRMWLGKPTADRHAPFERDYLGLETQIQNDGLRVIRVSPGSPAAAAGFKPGELITALNGSPANDVNMGLGLTAQPGQVLKVTLAGGVTRAVTLAAYY